MWFNLFPLWPHTQKNYNKSVLRHQIQFLPIKLYVISRHGIFFGTSPMLHNSVCVPFPHFYSISAKSKTFNKLWIFAPKNLNLIWLFFKAKIQIIPKSAISLNFRVKIRLFLAMLFLKFLARKFKLFINSKCLNFRAKNQRIERF